MVFVSETLNRTMSCKGTRWNNKETDRRMNKRTDSRANGRTDDGLNSKWIQGRRIDIRYMYIYGEIGDGSSGRTVS